MTERDTLTLREAGNSISQQGLVDDVKRPAEANRSEDAGGFAQEDYDATGQYQDDQVTDDADFDGSDDEYVEAPVQEDLDELESNQDDADYAASHEVSEPAQASQNAQQSQAETTYEVTIDGQQHKIPVSELQRGYQRENDYFNKTRQLADTRRALETHHAQVAQNYDAQLNMLGRMFHEAKVILGGELNSPQMEQLRQYDQQEWLMQRQLMQERIDKVDGLFAQVQQTHAQHANAMKQQQLANMQSALPEQEAILTRAIPDWRDGGQARLGQYLTSQGVGFTPQELNNVIDARMLIVAEKARMFDEMQAQRNAPKKRNNGKAPKHMKGGKGSGLQRNPQGKQQASKYVRARKLKAKAKQTGNMHDAGRAIASLLDD